MSEFDNLYLLLTRPPLSECSQDEEIRHFIDIYARANMGKLSEKIDKKHYPEKTKFLLYVNFILKVEEGSYPVDDKIIYQVVECFIELCANLGLKMDKFIGHILTIFSLQSNYLKDLNQVINYFELARKINDRTITEIIEVPLKSAFVECEINALLQLNTMELNSNYKLLKNTLENILRAKELGFDVDYSSLIVKENSLAWIEQSIYPCLNEVIIMKYKESYITILENLNKLQYSQKDERIKNFVGKLEKFRTNYKKNVLIEKFSDIIYEEENITEPHDHEYANIKVKKGKVGINKIAIKEIKPNSENTIFRIKKEIELLKKLSSEYGGEYFIEFYKDFHENDTYYICMDYIENSISKMIKKNRFSEDKALLYAKQLIKIYYFLCEKKIYHMDIKPENILFDEEREKLIIIDFGNSLEQDDIDRVADYPKENQEKKIIEELRFKSGTNAYMSPERKLAKNKYPNIEDCDKYDLEKSEIFSIGLTIFQMIDPDILRKYNEDECLIERLEIIKDKKLKELLGLIINPDPNQRSSFSRLAELGFTQTKNNTTSN